MAAPAYWAFISYSSADAAGARWLQRALERYRIPFNMIGRSIPAGAAPRHLRPIFRDRTDLAADPDLRARIDAALEGSAYLIVVCSPSAAHSRWVNEEIRRFRAWHGRERILAVIVDGDPASPERDCFPPALTQGSGDEPRFEPIAADLRRGGDGRRLVRLKLIAGMLRVGLDELIRRDDRRRHQYWMAVTAASLAGAVIAGALAAAAVFARNEAQRQRAHAEALIEFMLTDLRKRLEPGGHLDLMDGAGLEALKYYQAQEPHSLDASALSRRGRALRLMGEIRLQRGDLAEALQSFEAAFATTGELLQRHPNDGANVFNHAQNVFWVGEIARQRGDRAAAEASFRKYRELAGRLTALDPRNDDWQAEAGYAESALGVMLLAEGRATDATHAFERNLAVFQQLSQRHPQDINLELELGQSYAWLADAQRVTGRLRAARVERETELAIYRRVLMQDPALRQAKFSTMVALQVLGRMALDVDEPARARPLLEDAAQRGEALRADEPANMDLAATLAITEVDLGEAAFAQGDIERASAAQANAQGLLTTALAHDDRVDLWRQYRDHADLLRAAIAGQDGRHEEALRLDETVLARLGSPTPADAEALRLQGRAHLQSGDDLAALGRSVEALVHWRLIQSELSTPIETQDPMLLGVLEQAERRLGRTGDADRLAMRRAQIVRGLEGG